MSTEMDAMNSEEQTKVLQGLPEIFSESEKSEATKVSASSEVNDSQCNLTDNESDDDTNDHSSAEADEDTDSTNSSDYEEDEKTNENVYENKLQYQKSVLFTNDDNEALQITHYVLDGEKRININNFDFSKNDFTNVLSELDKEYEAKRKDLMFTIIIILFIVSLYVNASLWISLFMKSYNSLRK